MTARKTADDRPRVSFTRPDADGYRYCGDWRVIRTYGAKGHGSKYNVERRTEGEWKLVTVGLSYDHARRYVALKSGQESSQMTFRIEYVMRSRSARIVTETHFANSSAFAPVLRLAVGESTPRGRYISAGYKRITRIS